MHDAACECGPLTEAHVLLRARRGGRGRLVVTEGRTSAPRVQFDLATREEMFANLQVFRSEFSQVLAGVRSGTLSETAANNAARTILETRYEEAYRLGLRSFGIERFGDFDRAAIKSAVEQEMRFVRRFVTDAIEGTGSIPYGTRASYYARGYESMYTVGQFQALPWESDIYWRLGATDHCQDCVSLSESSPFSKATLPIIPGSGGTQCLFNCGCQLDYVQRPSSEARFDTDDGIARYLDAAPIPPGMRAPTVGEVNTIRDLWGSVQYHRTATRFSPPGLKAAHVTARQEANRALVDMLEKNSIHWTRSMEDTLFNPPPGGGVGSAAKGGRTGASSTGVAASSAAGDSGIATSLYRDSVSDLGEPE